MNERPECQSRRLRLLQDRFLVDSPLIRGHLFRLVKSLKDPGWHARIPTTQINDDDLPELVGCIRQLPLQLDFPMQHVYWVGTEDELNHLVNRILRELDQPGVIVHYAAEFVTKHERQLLLSDDVRKRCHVILTMERDPETTAHAREWPKEFTEQLHFQPWPKLERRVSEWRALFQEGLRRAAVEKFASTPQIRKDATKLLLETTWLPLDGSMTVVQFGRDCGLLALAESSRFPMVTREIVCAVRKQHELDPPDVNAHERPTYPPPPGPDTSSHVESA